MTFPLLVLSNDEHLHTIDGKGLHVRNHIKFMSSSWSTPIFMTIYSVLLVMQMASCAISTAQLTMAFPCNHKYMLSGTKECFMLVMVGYKRSKNSE